MLLCRACVPSSSVPSHPPPPGPSAPALREQAHQESSSSAPPPPTALMVENNEAEVARPLILQQQQQQQSEPDWRTLSTVCLAVATAMVAAATRSSKGGWVVALREAVLFLAGWLWGAYSLSQRRRPEDSPQQPSEPKSKPSLHGTSDARVASRLAKAIDFLEDSAARPEHVGWVRHGERRGVDVWFKAERGLKHARGVALFDAPPLALAQAIEDQATKSIYDKQWKRTTLLKNIDPKHLPFAETLQVVREEYSGVFPAKARDCVAAYARLEKQFMEKKPTAGGGGRDDDDQDDDQDDDEPDDDDHQRKTKKQTKKKIVLCLASFEAEDDRGSYEVAADDPAYVRMHISCGGYVIEPHGAGSKVTSVVVMDPKGMVPKSVVNFVAMDRPMGLARVRDVPLVKDPTRWHSSSQQKEEEETKEGDSVEDAVVAHAMVALKALLALDADPTTRGFAKDDAASSERRDVYFASSFALGGAQGKATDEGRKVKRYAVTKGPVKHAARAIHGALDANLAKIDKMRDTTDLIAEYGQPGDTLETLQRGKRRQARRDIDDDKNDDEEKQDVDDDDVEKKKGDPDFVLVNPIRCYYNTNRPILMTAPRESVVAVLDVKSADGTFVRLTTSVDHPDAPPETKQRVRMTIKLSGFVLRPTPTGAPDPTSATNVAVIDPNGGLAGRLQERLAKARTKQLDVLDTFF